MTWLSASTMQIPLRFLRHFWLKVYNDAVFEASILEYDRYSLGTPVSSTTYNWLVMNKPHYSTNVKNGIPKTSQIRSGWSLNVQETSQTSVGNALSIIVSPNPGKHFWRRKKKVIYKEDLFFYV